MTVLASMAEPQASSHPLAVMAVVLIAFVVAVVVMLRGQSRRRQGRLDSMSEDEFQEYINEIGGK